MLTNGVNKMPFIKENTRVSEVERYLVKQKHKKSVCLLEPIDFFILSQALALMPHNQYSSKAIKETSAKISIYADRCIDKLFME